MNDTERLENLINEGVRLHSTGNLKGASKAYSQALSENPRHPIALHLMGVIALQSGNFEEAAQRISKALEIEPAYSDAHSNLGNAYQAMQRFEEAAQSYEKALSINPGSAEVRANLGNARLQLGDNLTAVANFEAALKLNPNLPEAYRNMAVALLALGQPHNAWQAVARSQQLNPSSIELQLTAGNVLQALKQHDIAIQCYQRVLTVKPNFPQVLCNLGNVYRESGNLSEAAKHYDRAIEVDPAYEDAHHDRGVIHQDLGDMQLAKQSFLRALSINPLHGKSHRSLAYLTTHTERDNAITAMEEAQKNRAILPEQKMYLAYGLGKSLEDIGEYAQAFDQYTLANRLRRQAIQYSIDGETQLFSNIRNVFTPALFDTLKGNGLTDTTPIFIVGMPRSGTSLVEQILASHNAVHGAGELGTLSSLIAKSLRTKDGVDYTADVPSTRPETLQAIAAEYIRHLRRVAPSASFITDKLPANFLNIGMIHLMFPNARIIHCQRNPVDTCLSIYKNYFAASGHNYSYDLKELGTYYGLYEDLMTHWNSVLPGRLVPLCYEDLVANQESETRRLLAACGLAWDPSCIAFHNTKRPVFTLSAAQVRRPIYSESVALWRRYEPQLKPLLDALPKPQPKRN